MMSYAVVLMIPLILQWGCWLLLTHLSYYILAHRIKLLRLCLADDVGLQQLVPPDR